MKSALVASLGLCTLATASAHHPRHPHFHYRRQNETVPSYEPVTTLTVFSTAVNTVMSCAPTVTNCPGDKAGLQALASADPAAVQVVTYTDTVQLFTTICPVSAAASVTSSVYSAAATGGITGVTLLPAATGPVIPLSVPAGPVPTGGNAVPGYSGAAPLPTAAPSAAFSVDANGGPAPSSGKKTSTLLSTIKSTLTSAVPITVTITQPAGNVVVQTSTLMSTYVADVPVTKVASSPASVMSNSPVGEDGDYDTSNPGSGAGITTKGTSTTTLYSTGTRTATLTSIEHEATEAATSGNSAFGSTNNSGDTCVCPSGGAVTVTEPAKTVYVTVGAGTPAASVVPTTAYAAATDLAVNAASVVTPVTSAPESAATGNSATENSPTGNSPTGSTSESDDDDETCDEEETVTPSSAAPIATAAATDDEDDTCEEETATPTAMPTATGAAINMANKIASQPASAPPSGLPSGLPSDLPKVHPTGAPTFLAGGVPQGLPTGLPTGAPPSYPVGR